MPSTLRNGIYFKSHNTAVIITSIDKTTMVKFILKLLSTIWKVKTFKFEDR